MMPGKPRSERTDVTAAEIVGDRRDELGTVHASAVSASVGAVLVAAELGEVMRRTGSPALGMALADVEDAVRALNRAATLIYSVA